MSARARHISGAVVGLAVTAVATACGAPNKGDVVAMAGDLGHIHDLVIDENDEVFVASHTGLWRIEDPDRAVLVGTERHDLMAMAELDDGALVASGHPDLRRDEYRIEDHPPFLGLTRSDDGGRTWEVVDLLGEADFHALVPVGDQIFAAETTGRIWRLDQDDTWEQLGEIEARDLAVHPTDPAMQLAPDHDGTLWSSTDGAASWERLDHAPEVVEIEWPTSDRIFAASEDGTIWSATSPSDEWTDLASGPAEVETFHVDSEGRRWVTVHGGAILRSDDDGRSWDDIYVPPAQS